jgi:hypothetical protein
MPTSAAISADSLGTKLLDRTTTYPWPPNYALIRRERAARLRWLLQDLTAQRGAKLFYANGLEGCTAFIEDWCDTFDPRNAGTGKPTTMPFILFPRQREFLAFLHACVEGEADGLIEKCRDMGATWLCVVYCVWMFLFVEGATIGWGSQDGDQVDEIGNMSTIFEKIRWELRTIPRIFWPEGFDEKNGMNYMRVFAPNGNSITGECGDDIGRGGRTRVYFKDESAHYQHPESIEASLGDNTRVQIDISSVNGLGNVFYRKREAGIEWQPGASVHRGKTNVLVLDYSEHPDKTTEWYEQRRNKAISEGLLHKFAQEVERNYAASVEGVIIPAEWVKSAIDAHLKLGFVEHEFDDVYAGLDVADGDEGGDRNAIAVRVGTVLKYSENWGERDTGVTTRRAIGAVEPYVIKRNNRVLRKVRVEYDCIGVGAGVKAEVNRLDDDGLIPKGIELISWNAGSVVINPDQHVIINDDGTEDQESPLNKDFYTNLKAQGWWDLRRRFEKTHRMVMAGAKVKEAKVDGEQSICYSQDELISLDSKMPNLRTVEKELSQPTAGKGTRLRLLINKKPPGTRSPNEADAVMMCYFPVENSTYNSSMDWV